MAERKFKPGDRVRLIEMPRDGERLTLKVGDLGIAARVDCVGVIVDWLRDVNGHDGNGTVQDGHGWWVSHRCLELVEVNEVHIKSDGKKTEAFIKNGGRGSCICSKSDEFDFPTGAAIALARAYGIDPAVLAQRICKAVGSEILTTPEAEKLKLRMLGEDLGILGTPTALVDRKGAELCIGDTVLVRSKKHGYVIGEAFVVHGDGQDYVMGMLADCEGGKLLNKEFEVEWLRSWGEFKAGDVVGPVAVV